MDVWETTVTMTAQVQPILSGGVNWGSQAQHASKVCWPTLSHLLVGYSVADTVVLRSPVPKGVIREQLTNRQTIPPACRGDGVSPSCSGGAWMGLGLGHGRDLGAVSGPLQSLQTFGAVPGTVGQCHALVGQCPAL